MNSINLYNIVGIETKKAINDKKSTSHNVYYVKPSHIETVQKVIIKTISKIKAMVTGCNMIVPYRMDSSNSSAYMQNLTRNSNQIDPHQTPATPRPRIEKAPHKIYNKFWSFA